MATCILRVGCCIQVLLRVAHRMLVLLHAVLCVGSVGRRVFPGLDEAVCTPPRLPRGAHREAALLRGGCAPAGQTGSRTGRPMGVQSKLHVSLSELETGGGRQWGTGDLNYICDLDSWAGFASLVGQVTGFEVQWGHVLSN
jgi:hypothetical protein